MLIGWYLLVLLVAICVAVFRHHMPRFLAIGLTVVCGVVGTVLAAVRFDHSVPAERAAGYHAVTSKVVAYVGEDRETKVVTAAGNKIAGWGDTVPPLNEPLTYYCDHTTCQAAATTIDDTQLWKFVLIIVLLVIAMVPFAWVMSRDD